MMLGSEQELSKISYQQRFDTCINSEKINYKFIIEQDNEKLKITVQEEFSLQKWSNCFTFSQLSNISGIFIACDTIQNQYQYLINSLTAKQVNVILADQKMILQFHERVRDVVFKFDIMLEQDNLTLEYSIDSYNSQINELKTCKNKTIELQSKLDELNLEIQSLKTANDSNRKIIQKESLMNLQNNQRYLILNNLLKSIQSIKQKIMNSYFNQCIEKRQAILIMILIPILFVFVGYQVAIMKQKNSFQQQLQSIEMQLSQNNNLINESLTFNMNKFKIIEEFLDSNQPQTQSNILLNSDYSLLNHWINKNQQKMTLIRVYRASEDGFEIKTFYERCANIPQTLILVKSTLHKRFGGFVNSTFELQKYSTEKESKESFIFSLDQKVKYSINIKEFVPTITTTNQYFQIGYQDLRIGDNSNIKEVCNRVSMFGENEGLISLAGKDCYQSLEIEEYKIILE